jgi:hypothetical protein
MSNTKVFWGAFLICTGILLLMLQFNWINGNLGFVFSLWPLLIVLWGVSLLQINLVLKRIIVSASAILLSIFIVAIFSAGTNSIKKIKFWDSNHRISESESFNNNYKLNYKADLHDTLKFEINAAAGEYEIASITKDLVNVRAKGIFSDVSLNYFGKNKEIELDFDSDEKININFDKDDIKRQGKIKLNKNVVWDMDIDIGAASLYADLSEHKIQTINLSSGAAGVDIKVGELLEDVNIYVDAGVSSITLNIPKSFACTIKEDTGLSSLDLIGFKKIESGFYKTDNFADSDGHIYIEIAGGVSGFKIERYQTK